MRLKKKTDRAVKFLEGLHAYIVRHPQFRRVIANHTEKQIQTELRPIIVEYMESTMGRSTAYRHFYWEGEEGLPQYAREPVFAAKQYPDFVLTAPYKIAVEYKQGPYGSLVKQGLGQSLMHTMSGNFDFSLLLFHDTGKKKAIQASAENEVERRIISSLWENSNVMTRVV